MININGTLISYYFICKTKLWLHANRINLEDNSEDVRIGRILHQINEERNKIAELSIDNIKIDKITKDYLVEIKKSNINSQAAKWQVLLYLYKLKQKGVNKKGKIEYIEKKSDKKVEFIELDEVNESELLEVLKQIENVINQKTPPKPKFEKMCKKCAYFEYCFI